MDLLQERDANIRRGTPMRMLSRRCSIGATNYQDVETELYRQTSVSDITKAWKGTEAELQERTQEAHMAAEFGTKLLDQTAALEQKVQDLEDEKRGMAHEMDLLRQKIKTLTKNNATILTECQKNIDKAQSDLEQSEKARKRELEDRKWVCIRCFALTVHLVAPPPTVDNVIHNLIGRSQCRCSEN